MDSRETANSGPSMTSPAFNASKATVIFVSLHRADGLAATRADHFAMLVEKYVVVHDEQALSLDEFVERARMHRNGVTRPSRDIVAPGLPGVHRAGAAHPIIGRRAGKHEKDVDRRRGE